jgi:predicted porin
LNSSTFIRIGGEKRFGDFSFRAGYWQENSPYKITSIREDYTGFSLGLGIRFSGSSLDLAYNANNQNQRQQMYSLGLTDAADVKQRAEHIALTYSFRF